MPFAVFCLLSLFVGFSGSAAAHSNNSKQQPDAKQQQQDEAAAKKAAEEAKAKFAAMKGHFDAGTVALDQAKGIRAQMDKLPKDQQASMQGQLDMTSARRSPNYRPRWRERTTRIQTIL